MNVAREIQHTPKGKLFDLRSRLKNKKNLLEKMDEDNMARATPTEADAEEIDWNKRHPLWKRFLKIVPWTFGKKVLCAIFICVTH